MQNQLDVLDMENELIQNFADKYLDEALQIVATKTFNTQDNRMLFEALTIVVAIYMKKLKDGEIETFRVLH